MKQPNPEKFIAGMETEEQFDRVMTLLSDWIRQGIVSPEVDLDGDINIELPSEMGDLLASKIQGELSKKDLIAIVANEIPILASASLVENTERYLRARLPEKLHAQIAGLSERVKKVAPIISLAVKERSLLRRAANGYVIESAKWNAGTYHLNSAGQRLDVPYASIEVRFVRPKSPMLFSLMPAIGGGNLIRSEGMTVNMELHKDDIKNLTATLNKISESLNERK